MGGFPGQYRRGAGPSRFCAAQAGEHGWLAVETYSDYKQYITLNDYAISILEVGF